MADFEKYYDEISNLIVTYNETNVEIMNLAEENEKYQKQKKELFARFGGKYGNVKSSEVRNYSDQELLEMRLELANSAGFLAMLKSTFGIGKTQKDAYRELMGKLNGLLNYVDEQVRQKQSEISGIVNKLYKLSEEYKQAYESVKCYSGCTGDFDWSDYEMQESLDRKSVYIGEVHKFFSTANTCSDTTTSELPFMDARENVFRIPWGFDMRHPMQLCIDYTLETAGEAQEILQTIIYQMLRNMPQYFMEFHFIDAVTSGDDFKDFIRLQQVKKQDVAMLNQKVTGGMYHLAASYLKREDISRGMAALEQRMTAVVNEKAPYATVSEYNEQKGMDYWIPYQVIVAQNLQEGFSDDDLKKLQYLVENGNNLGVFVILMNNTERWRDDSHFGKKDIESCFSAEVLHNLSRIRLSKSGMYLESSKARGEFCHWKTGTAHTEFIEKAVQALGSEKKLDNQFKNFFNLNGPFGEMDSTDGLHIPFAVSQRGKLIEYSLGQAMNAHGLICGGTGSGKSSLLHMLISSIVMNYSPDDVELWLADYKITEFYSYKTNTPPHIRFIGLSKTSDFSYAFIDKIIDEMSRRQDLIAQADYRYKLDGGKNNITSFVDFRKVNGRTSMRRLMIVVDEFHVMSQHAQLEHDYKIKLENILSEARALGITLIFSDQAIVDGLRGLSDKGKKQIKARIALSNYMDELKETLNVHDNEQLLSFIHMKVGEVAVQTVKENEDKQEVARIDRATAVYINGACRYSVNEKAREVYNAREYTADVFDDRIVEAMKLNEINQWEEKNLKRRRDGSRDLYIYAGRPVNLDFSLRFPLYQRKGNNIMSVSGTEEQQMRILNAVVQSFIRQKDFEIRIMADPYAGLYREYEPEIRALSRNCSEIFIHDRLEDICYEVNKGLKVLRNRDNQKRYLYVWLGLDSMADIFSEETSRKPKSLLDLSDSTDFNEYGRNKKTNDSQTESIEGTSIYDEAMAAFDALFGADMFEDTLENQEENDGQFTENTDEGSGLYDARGDIAKLIHLGPTSNIFNFVIYDSASALRDFREVKTSDFNHKIAFVMSDYEAGEFLEQPRLIRDLAAHMAYYHDGRKGKRFIPYKL